MSNTKTNNHNIVTHIVITFINVYFTVLTGAMKLWYKWFVVDKEINILRVVIASVALVVFIIFALKVGLIKAIWLGIIVSIWIAIIRIVIYTFTNKEVSNETEKG